MPNVRIDNFSLAIKPASEHDFIAALEHLISTIHKRSEIVAHQVRHPVYMCYLPRELAQKYLATEDGIIRLLCTGHLQFIGYTYEEPEETDEVVDNFDATY